MSNKHYFGLWFLGIIFVEIISYIVVFYSALNAVLAVLIGVGVLAFAMRWPTAALMILSIEYLIGSKGALFKIGGDINNDGGVPVRMVLFAAFLLGWFVWSLRKKTWRSWRGYLQGRGIYLVLIVLLVYAFFLGLWHGSPFLLADANAWGTWLLLLPVLDIVHYEKDLLKKYLALAVAAALAWLALKTVGIFFVFTHGWAEVGGSVYLWLRRTGVGEVTNYGHGLHRVFFQSQIYGALMMIFLFIWSWFKDQSHKWILPSILLALVFAEVLISLSRSFWIGVVAGLLMGVMFGFFWKRFYLKEAFGSIFVSFVRSGAWFIGVGFVSFVLVWLVYALPGGRLDNRASFLSLFVSRVSTQEKAALSRWQLLPILWKKIQTHSIVGFGFGATVTYESHDPRIVAATGGRYTTYAFEWGWLDIWIKFGILGIPVMIFLLYSIGSRVWKNKELALVWRVGIPSSLVALVAIHVFTPYLNHPLGIVFLIGCEGIMMGSRTDA